MLAPLAGSRLRHAQVPNCHRRKGVLRKRKLRCSWNMRVQRVLQWTSLRPTHLPWSLLDARTVREAWAVRL